MEKRTEISRYNNINRFRFSYIHKKERNGFTGDFFDWLRRFSQSKLKLILISISTSDNMSCFLNELQRHFVLFDRLYKVRFDLHIRSDNFELRKAFISVIWNIEKDGRISVKAYFGGTFIPQIIEFSILNFAI